MQFVVFLALIITIMLMFISLQNPANITLKVFTWTFETSLALIFAITFGIGMCAGVLLSIPAWWRKTKEYRMQKKRVKELEREMSDMTSHAHSAESEEY